MVKLNVKKKIPLFPTSMQKRPHVHTQPCMAAESLRKNSGVLKVHFGNGCCQPTSFVQRRWLSPENLIPAAFVQLQCHVSLVRWLSNCSFVLFSFSADSTSLLTYLQPCLVNGQYLQCSCWLSCAESLCGLICQAYHLLHSDCVIQSVFPQTGPQSYQIVPDPNQSPRQHHHITVLFARSLKVVHLTCRAVEHASDVELLFLLLSSLLFPTSIY